jgi:hypothetical protein
MSGFAGLAINHAALASGLGTTFLPGVGPGAVQGFAVGTLLSGLCVLAAMAPRRISRRKRQALKIGGRHAAPPPGIGTRIASKRVSR